MRGNFFIVTNYKRLEGKRDMISRNKLKMLSNGLISIIFTLGLTACNSGGVPSNTQNNAAVTTSQSNDVHIANQDDNTNNGVPGNGTLVPVSSSTDTQLILAISPSGQYAYAANSDNDNPTQVSTYSINASTGELSASAQSAVDMYNPYAMSISPSGRYAYVVDGLRKVFMFSIDATTGALMPLAESVSYPGASPTAIAINPSGQNAYIVNLVDNTVATYSIDQSTGELTPSAESTIATGIGPSAIAISPSGQYAYVANCGNDYVSGSVSMYKIDSSSGELNSISPAVTAGDCPAGVTISPSGNYVYVVNNGGSVSMYKIDPSDGTLIPLATPTIATGSDPQAITIDPTGKYAYVVSDRDKAISMYSINSNNGELIPLATPVSTTNVPFNLVISPSGKYAYLSYEGSYSLSMYSIQNNQ